MILWVLLFLLIIAVSFVLAFLSMKDYQEIPEQSSVEYGLFLIRAPQGFGVNFIDSIGRLMKEEGLLCSIERLFKGQRAALTIFGPKKILNSFIGNLNLLELEDYTQNLYGEHLSVWEVGLTNFPQDSPNDDFTGLVSKLGPEDQFFWQMVLEVKKQGENIAFKSQIRAAIYSKDSSRKQALAELFQNLKFGQLAKVPKPFSTEQMMEFYKLRTLDKVSSGPTLSSEGVIRLLKL